MSLLRAIALTGVRVGRGVPVHMVHGARGRQWGNPMRTTPLPSGHVPPRPSKPCHATPGDDQPCRNQHSKPGRTLHAA